MTEFKKGDRVLMWPEYVSPGAPHSGTVLRVELVGTDTYPYQVGLDEPVYQGGRRLTELLAKPNELTRLHEPAEHAACRRRTNEEEEYLINREADDLASQVAENFNRQVESHRKALKEGLSNFWLESAPGFADYSNEKLDIGQEDEFHAAVVGVYQDARDLLLKKHHDYGPHNIGRSPGGPLNGLRVRIWDKVARINNLVDSGKEPNNESLKDSFVDLANYAMIAQLVLDGKWPSE